MRCVKRHLAAARACEMVVEDLAVDLEQLGRHRAHRRGGRDVEARFHVLDDARRRAAQRLRLSRRRARSAPCRCRRRGGGAARRGGRRRGESGYAVAGSLRPACRATSRAGLVVGEELAPPSETAVRVLLVEAVHLVDQARVGAESRLAGRIDRPSPRYRACRCMRSPSARVRRARKARSSDWRALSRGSQRVS